MENNNNRHQLIIEYPPSKSFYYILTQFLYTKKSFTSGFLIILIILLLMLYNILSIKNFSLLKLENDENYFYINFWLINIIFIIIVWNFFLFFYLKILNFKFFFNNNIQNNNNNMNNFLFLNILNNNNNDNNNRLNINNNNNFNPNNNNNNYILNEYQIRSSFSENFYTNPIGFILIIYYFESKFLSNKIDNSFYLSISVIYYIQIFYLINSFKNIDFIIDNYPYNKSFMIKIFMKVFLLFFGFSIFYNFIVFILTYGINDSLKFFILGKGLFVLLKFSELLLTRIINFKFLLYDNNLKEKFLIFNLKIKSAFELITMLYVNINIILIYLFAESNPIYLSVVYLFMIIIQFYQGIQYLKNYRKNKEYLTILEKNLQKISIKNDNNNLNDKNNNDNYENECIICTEKIIEGRKLSCGHIFHLVCISNWFQKGSMNCPICRKEIKIVDEKNNNYNNIIFGRNYNNRRRVFSMGFRVNTNNGLLGWLPNISMRIIRFNNINNNIIVNNNNNNHINNINNNNNRNNRPHND